MQCPQCKAPVIAGSQFCQKCGIGFNSAPQVKKNKLPGGAIAGIALASVVAVCAICGFIGAITDKTETTAPQTSQVSNTGNQPAATTVSATPTPPPTFAELKLKSESLLKMEKDEYSKADLEEFDKVMLPLKAIPKDSKDYKDAQALNKKLIDKSSVIAAEMLVLGPKPTNSEWDGSVKPAENYLKQTLNDYSSSEYLSWTKVQKIYVGKEPYWGTTVRIRAKNAFGAYVVNEIGFFIRNNQVVKATRLER